ncbi:MAG: NADH-quinone oxidoreductase subunit J [Thermoplasmatota archaeon]
MNLRKVLSAAIAVLVFAIIALSVAGTDAWQTAGEGKAEDMDTLVVALFTDHVIALEVLGVLLTAAMIGALTIARPIGGPTNDDEVVFTGHEHEEEE